MRGEQHVSGGWRMQEGDDAPPLRDLRNGQPQSHSSPELLLCAPEWHHMAGVDRDGVTQRDSDQLRQANASFLEGSIYKHKRASMPRFSTLSSPPSRHHGPRPHRRPRVGRRLPGLCSLSRASPTSAETP